MSSVPKVETGALPSDLLKVFEARAADAAGLLRALANPQRLLILCHLLTEGEMPVAAIVDRIGLSQSALSQHLARLREDGILVYRREAQSLVYRVADEKAARLLALLRDMFCPEMRIEGDQS